MNADYLVFNGFILSVFFQLFIFTFLYCFDLIHITISLIDFISIVKISVYLFLFVELSKQYEFVTE